MDRAVVGVGVGFYTLFSDIAQSSLCFQRVFTSEVYQAKLNANSIASILFEWKFRENQLTKLSSFKSRGLTLNVKWHSSMLQLDCGFPSIKCISIRSAHFIQMRTSAVVNLLQTLIIY